VIVNALAVMLMVVWVIGVIWLGVSALNAGSDWGFRACLRYAIPALFVFAVPIGIVMSLSESEHSNDLCLAGHQEWTRTTQPGTFAGKVYVPGGTSTQKVWVCDKWEAR